MLALDVSADIPIETVDDTLGHWDGVPTTAPGSGDASLQRP